MNIMPIKVLFIGEAWTGSCAASLAEALRRVENVRLVDINENECFPKSTNIVLKIINKLLSVFLFRKFEQRIYKMISEFKPDAMICYKGFHVHNKLLENVKKLGCYTVNVYPDLSPHGHGKRHKDAVGAYDLIISTKEFHPKNWKSIYGCSNDCLFVPQGYDPQLHLTDTVSSNGGIDVVLIATYRQEYGDLMLELAVHIKDANLSVVIGGNGWDVIRGRFPTNWRFVGPVSGQAYIDLLKSSKICIAPLTTTVLIQGKSQPGDVDTTRSYELAAANCFF